MTEQEQIDSVTFYNRDEEGNLTDYAGDTSAPENPSSDSIEVVETLIKYGVDNKITKGYTKAYPNLFNSDSASQQKSSKSESNVNIRDFIDEDGITDFDAFRAAKNAEKDKTGTGNTQITQEEINSVKFYNRDNKGNLTDYVGDTSDENEQIGDVQGEFMPSNPDFRGAGNNKEYKTVKVNSQTKVPDSKTNGDSVIGADSCSDNTLDSMQLRLDNFFNKITGPGSAILNLPNEIKAVSDILSTSMGGFVNKMLGSLGDYLQKSISAGFNKIATAILAKVGAGFPYPAAVAEIVAIQTSVMPAISKLFDGVRCVGSKIGKALKGVFSDLISSTIKNMVKVPACAVQQIVGAATNKIKNMIDAVTGPLLGPVAKVLGISNNIKGFLSGGIDVLKGVNSFLSCSPPKPKCAPVIKMGMGTKKSTSTNDKKLGFKKIFDGSNKTALSDAARDKADEFEKEYGKWPLFGNTPLLEASELDPCYTGNPLECGLPKVEIFGGGGFGAAGKVIFGGVVNKLDMDDIFKDAQKVGSIIGVEITNPGSGYTSDPIVTFEDNCGQGYGAYGKAHIDFNQLSPTYGQVTSITMLCTGDNYPAEEEPPLYIEKIIIEDPGEGYKDGDTLDDFQLEILNGRIDETKFEDRRAYDNLPKLNINSDTGVGAILKPIMSRKRPQGDVVQVIDCVG